MENLQENYSQHNWTSPENSRRDPYGELRTFLGSISTDNVTVGRKEKAEFNLPYEQELEHLEHPHQTGDTELYIVEEPIDKGVDFGADTVIELLMGDKEVTTEYELSQQKYAYLVPEKDGVTVGGDEELVEHCNNIMESRRPDYTSLFEEAKVRGKNWKNGISSLLE